MPSLLSRMLFQSLSKVGFLFCGLNLLQTIHRRPNEYDPPRNLVVVKPVWSRFIIDGNLDFILCAIHLDAISQATLSKVIGL